ncbi:DUF6356 family protein [Litoreibacter roseus]|uniref:DUF6356 family protein n=1 Tax=Litoreibacter roseus TaxID=2601869 RepID=UPI001FA99453|nr:DUF6356 family protein [Litoreibacter roseus]
MQERTSTQTANTAAGTSFASLFTSHPQSVGETYLQHQVFALRFAFRLLRASGAAFVHAVVPGLCQKTASREIHALHAQLSNRAPDHNAG